MDISRAKFMGKLKGTVADFGFIKNRKQFFKFLEDEGFIEYGTLVHEKNGRSFHVYMVHKDFNYSSSWIQNHDEICNHNVGANGSLLVDIEYRAIGYRSQI